MNPLLGIAFRAIPDLIRLVAGDKTGSVADDVVKTVKKVADEQDDDAAATKIEQDPKLRADLQKQLADIALALSKTQQEAEDSERKAELEGLQAQIAEAAEVRKAEFTRLEKELVDRAAARDMYKAAMKQDGPLAWVNPALSMIISIGFITLVYLLLYSENSIPDNNQEVFYIALGALATAFATVVGFHFGSSSGSKKKQDFIAAESIARAERESAPPPTPESLPKPTPGSPPADGGGPVSPIPGEPSGEPVAPASPKLTMEVLKQLAQPHNKFPGSVKWELTPDGIAVDGAAAERTAGNPATVTDIWTRYGDACAASSKEFGVPVELIVATIATESRGNPNAERYEAHLNEKSVGLMQTLVSTASEALGRRISGNDLRDPSLSIQAGTAYIARQRASTHFDPPLVAAAYNAGSLRRENAQANRWRLRCHPRNTGQHIDRFVAWFGDAMHVSREQNWGNSGRVPSFASAFGVGPVEGPPARVRVTGPLPSDRIYRSPVPPDSLTRLSGFSGEPIPLTNLSRQVPLVQDIQTRLSDLGYLDPPSDGKFGPISQWALSAFASFNNLAQPEELTDALVRALLHPARELPAVPQTGDWFDRVIAYMNEHAYWICRYPGCRNIVYLEGANTDGTLNDDRENRFNDLRTVFWIDSAGNLERKVWDATTEPGRIWTVNPMNNKGAARIKFGQYAAWQVGMHRGDHEGLLQVANVSVHRDLNKDYKRTNDYVDTGLFGINQHWGYNNPSNDIRKASAGCLVGRTTRGHQEFMNVIKEDPRYRISTGYRFITTILPADQVLA